MRFSIITPTYKRGDMLTRAVQSVQNQTYTDWELIIINDSPTDRAYSQFASSINDARIHYHTNDINHGVNYSRNYGLDKVSADSKWIIFLDDDDYLAPDALKNFHDLILTHPEYSWFVTNRAYKNGTPMTRAPRPDTAYSYFWSYLFLKKIRGDATHCISTAALHTTRFLCRVKQGEEWFFFYQVGMLHRFYYSDHNSTISDGYDQKTGLNFRKRSKVEKIETLSIIFYEALERGFAYRPTFLLYLAAKLVRVFV